MDAGSALAQGLAHRLSVLARQTGASAASVQWVARAAEAISRATAEGHVCLSLQALAQHDAVPLETVRAALLASGVVSDAMSGLQDGAGLRPLVIDPQNRLYLARYYDYERRFAAALVAHAHGVPETGAVLAQPASPVVPAAALRARLLQFFGTPHDEAPDWQRLAAVIALSGPLTVVSGGPGTGKTTTVVGVLACLLDTCADLRIALAAPTGKAAQRMQEALAERAGALPAALAARLPHTSYTLHRLLGYRPDGGLRYHRDNPLPYDVLVVDEASMIDVAMAAHLFDAIAPDTRVVLLGDKDQLAAVEAGAVFAELSARPAFSSAGLARLAAALDLEPQRLIASLPEEARQVTVTTVQATVEAAGTDPGEPREAARAFAVARLPAAAPMGHAVANPWLRQPQSDQVALADCVVWLERNYRFGLTSPIGQFSLAIRRGEVDKALAALAYNPTEPCPAAFYEDSATLLKPSTLARLSTGFASYAEALGHELAATVPDLTRLFDALNCFRILCATRAGPRGVDSLNELMAGQLQRAVRLPRVVGTPWFAGRPVMVTQNDAALGLFNGDTGIALPDADGALKVYFRTGKGAVRSLSPAALPPHDTALALTVHKSQGSEFEHVALMLPEAASRVLSRELVYTAVTRARMRIEITGARTVLAQAIATPTQRDSGLATRIAEALAARNA
nr:AAA family ATPase [Paraburkholderia hayleyella]